ncbi:MAG: hypothetical protein JST30_10770 [Armatimonadetes bacterium]|nr:hypothetical protein [Armatimonadota bacterium]
MITCNLTKPELTFDAIRKAYKNLKPTDVALVATALIESGKFAKACHDGIEYEWTTEDHAGLTKSLFAEVAQLQEGGPVEKPKKATAAEVEEAVTLQVHLKPSQLAGAKFVGDREDLKTLLADILEEGVEFLFSPTDIGWHWTLERVNWSTISGGELKRRVKFRPVFDEGAVAVELGPGGKRKVSKK